MEIANNWVDYELLDMADGLKLEKWGPHILIRPDPQIIWKEKKFPELWKKAEAEYVRSNTGGGQWRFYKNIHREWTINYKDLKFNVKLMNFKHTGVFPEQAVNWDWMINKIKNANKTIKVLNLFAYTGAASVACLSAGAEVTHVDASKGIIELAKENVKLSGFEDRKIRYLVDDVNKFVAREIRRGNKYDAIIMDPPSYGRGSNGETWKFESDIEDLVKTCSKILSDKPLFFLINSYTTGISSMVLENILKYDINNEGKFSNGEIGLPMKNSNMILPCGIFAKWEN